MTDRRLWINPFATRYTRPGVIAWQPTPDSPEALIERLDRVGGRGLICGPHGSGKSTLLRHLMAAAAGRGWKTRVIALRSRADLGPALGAIVAAAGHGHWLGIDSWEKLGSAGRLLVPLAARRGGRIVVTTHQPHDGWPILLNLQPDAPTFRRLVGGLLSRVDSQGTMAAEFAPDQLDAIFQRHRGNLREAFFELYDHFERVTRPLIGEV
ncbi:MAG: hypothetical protein EBS83_01310 [Planctomycetia bacterium]|jgi:hypothetical protein|nr:hypothetical protein [Planctomycetia bacterium]